MRYALIDILACPHCHGELACWTHAETSAPVAAGPWRSGTRVSAGPGLGPAPADGQSAQSRVLQQFGTPPADPRRSLDIEVISGLLLCGGCGRWYPIEEQIPEILPDHLRNAAREVPMFQRSAAAMPAGLRQAFERFTPSAGKASDAGMHHKIAEIGIRSKIDDAGFFGPGYSAPFNPWNPSFTHYLITLLGNVFPLLDMKQGELLIDSGCGYAWTTEWFHRSGVDVIGVDICRTYLDIGIERMGPSRPHLVVGDVENLPVRNETADGIMAFESFHHLPDRQAAMRGYERALKPAGRVALAEPGAAHEAAQVSIDVMEKYGILEKGMELSDVIGYAAGTALGSIEQRFVVRARGAELGSTFDRAFVNAHSIEGNLFTLVKAGGPPQPATPVSRRRAWPGIKRRIKRLLPGGGRD